jgi:penicillin amidase
MIRGFRTYLAQQVFDAVTITCRQADPDFSYRRVSQSEGPLWALVTARPAHLLNPKFSTWDEQFLAGVDAALDFFTKDGAALAARTWGERNTTRIQHPLSLAVPALGRWLDMPAEQLPGDSSDMPRVKAPARGSPCRRVTKRPGTFTCPAVRAAIRCRRITPMAIRPGPGARQHRFCLVRQSTR